MRFQTELVPATLIKRYKRFLADCRLADGTEIIAHCANPGSMMGLADPGTRVWLEPNDDPRKKLKFGWRLVEHANGQFTGVDTSVPNRALKAAFEAGTVPGFETYTTVRPEQKYDENSRIDFLLQGEGQPDAYIEVKSVTLSRTPGLAEFPDSVTARGAKHLGALAVMAGQWHRAVMLYLVQRTDCDRFTLAADLDPNYAKAYADARNAGLETLCLGTHITPQGIDIAGPLAVVI